MLNISHSVVIHLEDDASQANSKRNVAEADNFTFLQPFFAIIWSFILASFVVVICCPVVLIQMLRRLDATNDPRWPSDRHDLQYFPFTRLDGGNEDHNNRTQHMSILRQSKHLKSLKDDYTSFHFYSTGHVGRMVQRAFRFMLVAGNKHTKHHHHQLFLFAVCRYLNIIIQILYFIITTYTQSHADNLFLVMSFEYWHLGHWAATWWFVR